MHLTFSVVNLKSVWHLLLQIRCFPLYFNTPFQFKYWKMHINTGRWKCSSCLISSPSLLPFFLFFILASGDLWFLFSLVFCLKVLSYAFKLLAVTFIQWQQTLMQRCMRPTAGPCVLERKCFSARYSNPAGMRICQSLALVTRSFCWILMRAGVKAIHRVTS